MLLILWAWIFNQLILKRLDISKKFLDLFFNSIKNKSQRYYLNLSLDIQTLEVYNLLS